jgi:hypothetical protein
MLGKGGPLQSIQARNIRKKACFVLDRLSIFTVGVYRASDIDAVFSQRKTALLSFVQFASTVKML